MELELGLKLSRVADEFASADLHIAKDRAGPVFVSNETDTTYILTAHLKGYTKENVKIEINEDGTCIAISGEKPVQEMIMVGWQVHKQGVEIKRFRRSYKIPDGVILDEIVAKFNEDESVLTITMPKKVKGIRGNCIEEVKEKENITRQGSGTLQIVDDETSRGEPSHQQQRKDEESEAICSSKSERANEKSSKKCVLESGNKPKGNQLDKITLEENDHQKRYAEGTTPDQLAQNHEKPKEKTSKQELSRDIQDSRESQCVLADQHKTYGNQMNGESDKGSAEETQEGEFPKNEEGEVPERRSAICAPIVAGSAILISLVVFVFRYIRQKNQSGKRQS